MLAIRPDPHPAPAFAGVYDASVVAVDDTTHRGRIQVAVPAVFDGTGPDAAVWARPCFAWGHFYVPEVGAHVWVAFENGDPSSPVWLGTWYPSGQVPAEARVSPPKVRAIRTAAGHRLTLDDTAGSEKLTLAHSSGAKLEITGTDLKIEAPGKTITVSGAAIVLRAPSVDVQSG